MSITCCGFIINVVVTFFTLRFQISLKNWIPFFLLFIFGISRENTANIEDLVLAAASMFEKYDTITVSGKIL